MPTYTEVEKHSKKNIVLGTFFGYLNLLLTICSGLVFTPWIIAEISKSTYGLYSLSNSLVALFLLDFGLSSTTNALLSKLRAKGEKEEIYKFISCTYKIYLIIDAVLLIVFALAFFSIDYIYVGLSPTEKSQLKIIFLITATFSLISFPTSSFNGIIHAYEEFCISKIIECTNKILYIAFSATCIFLHLGVYALVTANCLAGFISIICKILTLRFKCGIRFVFCKSDWKYAKKILSFSVFAAINSLAARLVFNVMPSILGVVSNSDNITLFSVGASIESYVYSFGSIMGGFFLPKLTRLKETENSQKQIDKLAIKVGKIQLFIVGLIIIGFVCTGKDFVMLWMNYDKSFVVSYYGACLIILNQIIFVPQLIYYTELFTGETIKKLAIVSIIKAAINFTLSFLFGHLWGAFGAFLSITIARLFEIIAQNFLYKKYLFADIKMFFKNVYLPYLIPFAISVFSGLMSHLFFPGNNLPIKFFKSVAYIVIFYVPICFVSVFSSNERNKIFSLIRRKK